MNYEELYKNLRGTISEDTLKTVHRADVQRELKARGVAGHLHGGIVRYIVDRIRPGDFLLAVLQNDLAEAVVRCSSSLEILKPLVEFLNNAAPRECWGSEEKVRVWMEGKIE